MYESYWNLRSNPFRNSAQVEYYFESETHQAALLKLRYAVENRKGAALLSGPVGSGKTLLVNVLCQHVPETVTPLAWVVFPQMTPAELLTYLAAEMGALEQPGHDVNPSSDTVRQLRAFLADNAAKGNHGLVVIDEAHLIEDPHLFESLRLLMNFQHEGQYTFTLVLAGQPSLLTTLSRMGPFDERLAVKCLLRPLSPEETAGYVNHRLQVAGATRPLLEPDALRVLHDLSGGVPASINRLCDLALLVGYAENVERITGGHFEAVAEELATVAPE
ncbi:MAG: ExeA family protein [Pirellulales bacterium]